VLAVLVFRLANRLRAKLYAREDATGAIRSP